MTATDAAEKVTSSIWLTVFGKIAPVLLTIMVTVGLFIAGQYLNATSKTLDAMTSRIDTSQEVTSALDRRVGNIETRISVVGPSRDAFQAQTTQTFREVVGTLQQLTTDMATTKRDVGYLRDYVEDLKRRTASALP